MENHPHGRHVTRQEFFYVLQDNYDEHAEVSIPGYLNMHTEMEQFASRRWNVSAPLRILDLGTGTGKTVELLLDHFPQSTAVAVDIFDEMLNHAQIRLCKYGNRVELRKGDFSDMLLEQGYDLCVSALAIHHQNPQGKRDLFSRIYQSLMPGGCFCMIDWIKFDDPREEGAALEAAEVHVRSAVPDKIADQWVEHWRELNIPDTAENMCQWLRDAGFSFVFCPIHHYGMALIYAIKES